jgi:hypothetical protein
VRLATLYQERRRLQVQEKERPMIFRRCLLIACGLFATSAAAAFSQNVEPPAKGKRAAQPEAAAKPEDTAQPSAPAEAAPGGLVKLSKTGEVWLDTKRKAVVADGQICLREGLLEMFACPKGTKEHESIVAVNCQAYEIHAGLLAAGAKPGTPVAFQPEYKPATGQTIDVYVLWKDAAGNNRQVRAQEWVREFKSKEPMKHDWVFAGSGFWRDEETGKEHYKANGGDLVCVSNFPTAMLDLPIESSQANADLMFEAFTDRIPPRGTKVRLVFIPRAEGPGTQQTAQ